MSPGVVDDWGRKYQTLGDYKTHLVAHFHTRKVSETLKFDSHPWHLTIINWQLFVYRDREWRDVTVTTSHPSLPCQLRSGISSSTMRKSYFVHPFQQNPHVLMVWRQPSRNDVPIWRMSRLSIWSFGGARNLRCCPLKTTMSCRITFWKLIFIIRNRLSNLPAELKWRLLGLAKTKYC